MPRRQYASITDCVFMKHNSQFKIFLKINRNKMTFYFRSSDRNAVNKHVKLEKKPKCYLISINLKKS